MKKLSICVMAGRQVGVIGILTILARGHNILSVVAYDSLVKIICKEFNLPVYTSIKNASFLKKLEKSDLLVSIHGREIVPDNLLFVPKYHCINVHPCLYKYKGKDPIKQLLKEKNEKASVGIHYMTNELDQGTIIIEEFINVKGLKDVEAIYNALYPYYSLALSKALNYIDKNNDRRNH